VNYKKAKHFIKEKIFRKDVIFLFKSPGGWFIRWNELLIENSSKVFKR